MPNRSDDELVQAILKGDESAAEPLIDRYNRFVYKTMRAKVGNAEDAEDLTQDVWTKVYNSGHSYNPRLIPERYYQKQR